MILLRTLVTVSFVICGALSSQTALAQSADPLQINVPSLNMPTDQQLELGKAIYQQLVAQGITATTLILVDVSGVQASFETATLSTP